MTTAWRLLATPVVAVAAGLGVVGLSGLVVFDDWAWLGAAVLGSTAATVVLVRVATGRPFLPTAVGALAAAWLLLIVYVPGGDGGRTWIPTPAAWGRALEVGRDAVSYAAETVAPAPVEPALSAAITTGVVALFLMVDAIAVGAGFAASAGLVLLVPWLPALILERRLPTAALVGAIAAWLIVVALSRRLDGGWRARGAESVAPPPLHVAVAATAVTVGAALVAVPLAVGGPGWGAAPRLALPEGFAGTTRLDLEIDLRDSLTRRSDDVVLTYASVDGPVEVMRMYSFAYFDGAQWDRDDPGDLRSVNGDVLWPEGVRLDSDTDAGAIAVEIGRLGQDRVPVPGSPRRIPAGTGWEYDPATDEVITRAKEGTQGASYTVRFDRGYHSEDALRASQQSIDAGGDASVGARYRDLPAHIDDERILAITRVVTAQAEDRLDQATLIMDYLREGGGFEYSTEVTPGGDDAVSTFLTDGRGYCVQFATAMVVMARTLDIPARLAVGFLGGADDGTGRFAVKGRDAHAWPELYFPGHGWVRFEPTPAAQATVRPAYAPVLELEEAPGLADIRPSTAPGVVPPLPVPSQAPTATPTTAGLDAGGPSWPAAVGATGVTLVVLAALAWVWWRRQPVLVADAEAAWSLLRRRLGERAGADALTPAEAEEWMLREGPRLPDDAREALGALREAVSDERYAPAGSAVRPETLRAWVETVVIAAHAAERAQRRSDRAATRG